MIEKLFKSKAAGFLAIGLAAGILLLVFGGKADKAEPTPPEPEIDADTDADYVSRLETRVAELLTHVDGISDVRVMITPESTKESVYLSNESRSQSVLTEWEYVLDDGGEPVRIKLVFPEIRGIAVVCRGGSNPINREKVVSLLCSLFGVSANRVFVTG